MIAGEHDLIKLSHLNDMQNAIPNSEIHIIKNAGHSPHFSHPKCVNTTILDFLERNSNNRDVLNEKN